MEVLNIRQVKKLSNFFKCFLTLVHRSLFLRWVCFSFCEFEKSVSVFSAGGRRRDEKKRGVVTFLNAAFSSHAATCAFKSSILEENTSRVRVQGFEKNN